MTSQSPISQPALPSEVTPIPSIFNSTGAEQLEALASTKADRDALDPAALRTIFADIHTASARVIGATLRAADYDAELAALPGGAGVRAKAQVYAKAASQAQTDYLNTFSPPEGFLELIEKLKETRESFMREADVLIYRKVIHAEQLDGLHRTTGYRPIVNDVKRLSSLLRDVLPRLAGKSFLTMEEISAGSAMAFTAEKMLELRDDKEKARADANDTRQRAFTLLANTYDQLRKLLTFVLWERGNLDEIAPAMQVNTRRGRSSDDEEEPEVEPGVPAAGGAAVGSSTPAVATGANAPGGAASAVPGVPSASPFING